MKPILFIHLRAQNDTNGNPRRVFVVFNEDGNIIEAIDEGYRGQAAVTKKYPGLPNGGSFITTPAEYRHLLKEWAR